MAFKCDSAEFFRVSLCLFAAVGELSGHHAVYEKLNVPKTSVREKMEELVETLVRLVYGKLVQDELLFVFC